MMLMYRIRGDGEDGKIVPFDKHVGGCLWYIDLLRPAPRSRLLFFAQLHYCTTHLAAPNRLGKSRRTNIDQHVPQHNHINIPKRKLRLICTSADFQHQRLGKGTFVTIGIYLTILLCIFNIFKRANRSPHNFRCDTRIKRWSDSAIRLDSRSRSSG
jgi:hypothetical protein